MRRRKEEKNVDYAEEELLATQELFDHAVSMGILKAYAIFDIDEDGNEYKIADKYVIDLDLN